MEEYLALPLLCGVVTSKVSYNLSERLARCGFSDSFLTSPCGEILSSCRVSIRSEEGLTNFQRWRESAMALTVVDPP